MRRPTLSSACALVYIASRPVVSASWIPNLFETINIPYALEKRCTNPCGYYSQLCCNTGEVCYTDTAGRAQCGASGTAQNTAAAAAGGSWQYYTTTYVQTDLKTVTATYSTYLGAQTTAPATAQCSYSQGETACGAQCCLSGQYCNGNGACMAVPGGSSGFYSSLYTVTTVVTNTASAGIRPTTQTVRTITSTNAAGTTVFQTPVSTSGSLLTGTPQPDDGGLSGGAIAGIVIGVILGVLILLAICLCCIFKGLLDGFLAIFGLGPRRRRRTEETIIEERHSHRSGAAAGRRTWFGVGPRRKTEEVIEVKKKKSTLGPVGWAAAGLGGLALILGLKRRNDRRDNASASGYTGSSYDSYYDDYTRTSSSPSSVTRTRSRSRSRVSRGTRR